MLPPHFDASTDKAIATNLTLASPSLQYAEGQLRGYFQLTVSPSNVTADYYGFYEQHTRNSNATHMGTFVTLKDTNQLQRPLNGGKVPDFGVLQKGQ